MKSVTAPGKLMIAGEYAVLEGATAIVAAVNLRASVGGTDVEREVPKEVAETRALAERLFARNMGALAIDVHELRREHGKLGLGSSAALSAATAGLAFACNGEDISQQQVRAHVFDLALRGHRAVAPDGSGADVAASVFGGILQFTMPGTIAEQPWTCPISTRVVWTGKEARTSELVAKVQAFKASAPKEYDLKIAQLSRAADAMRDALASSSAINLLLAVNEHHHAMNSFGDAAEVALVDETLAEIAELTHSHGGASKASGAGGGDVALCFFKDEAAAARFETKCEHSRFTVLPLEIGAEGVAAS
ncbi:MAG: hypothetical protein IPK60_13995 [Sandaracinaceae bacterium]|nr:hypothetical protein [Sandaracinaceae bacterium]